MSVRFVFAGDNSYYSFSSEFIKLYNSLYKDFAPDGVCTTYGRDTEMFCFLDSVLPPSSLERIVAVMDGVECFPSLVYSVDHVPVEDIYKLLIPLDDLSF